MTANCERRTGKPPLLYSPPSKFKWPNKSKIPLSLNCLLYAVHLLAADILLADSYLMSSSSITGWGGVLGICIFRRGLLCSKKLHTLDQLYVIGFMLFKNGIKGLAKDTRFL
ncbi:hypothetical protein CDAR_75971 [Caerostris darwini]|uniref:Uncharacterized protein n=1 Tax=Caerostris darwini TaxID=1538125 RepID=A0AAV4Q9J1_9ARAC|nr:hypothetical protein CDAR_75971 [Caerostris darwini]